ncbi:branched-chain amino acid ABC transporter permease [Haloarchaeobius sp. TZWWS8]|uniref:branched-chain amino acid ABC transporter permease n=1 Tax=Haloarchaeobius sp. TZWWS8 TaxID=3446121 RepID=UPI003EC0AD41
MGVNNTVDRGRQFVLENPGALLVGAIGVFLLVDFLRRIATGDLAFSKVATNVYDGLLRGLVIGLAGIGLSMTYSILNFANFSHGDYLSTGAFVGWGTTYLIAGLGAEYTLGSRLLVGAGQSVTGSQLGIGIASTPLAILVGVVIAGGLTAGLALAMDKMVYKPMRDADGISLLIASIGVAFALRYLLAFIFGPASRGTTSFDANPAISLYFIDGNFTISAHDITLVVISVGLMAGVHYLLQYTKLGKAMRAMSENEDLARVTGIPTERVIKSTWVIGGALTGIAGYMLVLWSGTISFQDGWLLLLLIFAAVILGGIGSIYGAIVGGLVIGVTASIAVFWIPSSFARVAAFVVMIVILLFKPQGIFSGRSTS